MLLHRKNDSRDAISRSLRRYDPAGLPAAGGLRAGGIAIDAQQEVGIDEQALERELDAAVEAAALFAAASSKNSSSVRGPLRHRTAIGEPGDPRQNLRGARASPRATSSARRRRSRARLGVSFDGAASI